MTIEPLRGNYRDVCDHALRLARDGDHRARPAEINGTRRIITPHTTPAGDFDADDLAAQVYALAHGLTSIDGHYTGGFFLADGLGHYAPAPTDAHSPAAQDTAPTMNDTQCTHQEQKTHNLPDGCATTSPSSRVQHRPVTPET